MSADSAALTTAASSGLALLAADAAGAASTPVSLYVHVPFCLSKCAYCDFYSETGESRRFSQFVDAVLFEAGHWSHYGLLDDVPTMYVGGGTPTVMGPELVRLVRGLGDTAHLRPDAEITVETNPETTDAALVAALVDAGANRFSIGVQSFDDSVLTTLGRCHDVASTARALDILRAARVSFSIDLICGVPGQSFESWDDTLEKAVNSGARHVSVYPLTVEDGTPLDAAIRDGRSAAPDPDVAAEMMLVAEVALSAAGLLRYEVANYAQPGHESRHNSVYWTGGAYLGVGPHAASMLPRNLYAPVGAGEGWGLPVTADGGEPARIRWTREVALADYVRDPLAAPAPMEALSGAEAAREDVMLGLRLTDGVPADQVQTAGVTRVLEQLEGRGLVRLGAGRDGLARWRTTQNGWLLGNEVFSSVWAGE